MGTLTPVPDFPIDGGYTRIMQEGPPLPVASFAWDRVTTCDLSSTT